MQSVFWQAARSDSVPSGWVFAGVRAREGGRKNGGVFMSFERCCVSEPLLGVCLGNNKTSFQQKVKA